MIAANKMYWTFYKSTLTTNIAVSLLVGVASISISVFTVSFSSIGLFVAFLQRELMRPQEYYFYYNQCISKVKLIIFCLSVNILLSALILTIAHYVTFT